MPFFKTFFFGSIVFVLTLGQSTADEVLLHAKKVMVYQEQEKIRAEGDVRLYKGKEFLHAKVLEYHKKTDTLYAYGHVCLKDESGHYLHGERAQITGNLKEGFVHRVHILLAQNKGRLVGKKMTKTPQGVHVEQALFTTCQRHLSCPVWRIRADSVLLEGDVMTYRGMYFQMWNVSLLPIPSWHIPLKRKSGLLPPVWGSTNHGGTFVGLPYYFALDPKNERHDLLVTSYISSKRSVWMKGVYRRALDRGVFVLQGAVNATKIHNPRMGHKTHFSAGKLGHVHGEFRYDVSEHWRWRSDEMWVFEKNYTEHYRFLAKDLPASVPYISSYSMMEGFHPDTYTALRHLRFHPLTEQQQKEKSNAPMLDHFFWWRAQGVQTYTHVNATHLRHKQQNRKGYESGSLENKTSIPFQFQSIEGETFLHQRLDCFRLPAAALTQGGRGFARYTPTGGVNIQRSFYQGGGIWTPKMQFLMAPTGGKKDRDTALHPQNYTVSSGDHIFALNRFQGYEYMEYGRRLQYGVEAWYPRYRTRFFLGQSVALSRPSETLKKYYNVNRGTSPLEGKIETQVYPDIIWFSYGAQAHKQGRHINQHQAEILWGPAQYRLITGYTAFKKSPTSRPVMADQYTVGTELQVNEWSFHVKMHRLVREKIHTRSKLTRNVRWNAQIAYKDECLRMDITFEKKFLALAGKKPVKSIFFNLTLVGVASS